MYEQYAKICAGSLSILPDVCQDIRKSHLELGIGYHLGNPTRNSDGFLDQRLSLDYLNSREELYAFRIFHRYPPP